MNDNNTQNLVAFRQLYEDNYPGHDGGAIAGVGDDHHDAYSQGYRINKPVFPTLGNHDSPYYNDDPKDWCKAADYIADRIVGAQGLVAHYGKVAYIWRWGQYYFIQLGLWAGSYEHESASDIDYNKLQWLEDKLAQYVGDSGLGVLIFQHYGWDSFSTDGRWWSSFMRNLEIDVLMRRPLGSGNTVPGNPYNVIGIFTGHRHDHAYPEIFAGLDALGDSVYFDNLTMRSTSEHYPYGYAIVHLSADSIRVEAKECHYNNWDTWSKPIHLGP